MREIIKLGLVLLLITAISATILGLSNGITSKKIEEVEAKASQEARKEVLPKADNFEPVDIDTDSKVLAVYKSDAGYAIKTATPGYGGNVEVITGISKDGAITGVKVVKHQETPGLGANATGSEFQNQYKGIKAKNEVLVVKTAPSKDNQIQALTGATITSDAVTKGVNIARTLFNEKLNK
ncbi:MAG: RnfABCDGE type electron transport complex subunit G [Firmicutes bacterium]|nr:RnfABCDGE type electron transport complex subunit G [Bacillota bacterium]MTI68779.1 RnfABCDGE type electron transport complex subunit G [Bacillota bacterium]